MSYVIGYIFDEISTELKQISRAIKLLITRVKARLLTNNILDLLNYLNNLLRIGRPRRSKPRDALSIVIRYIATTYDEASQYIAIPREVRKRKALGKLLTNLKTLVKKQIYRIIYKKEYYDLDLRLEFRYDLLRNKYIIKNYLTDKYLRLRKAYYYELQSLYYTNTMIIYYNKKTQQFRGSIDRRRTVRKGAILYITKKPIRFSIQTQNAIYGKDTKDPLIKRLIYIQDIKSQNLEGLKAKLDQANRTVREVIKEQQRNTAVKGTTEQTIL